MLDERSLALIVTQYYEFILDRTPSTQELADYWRSYKDGRPIGEIFPSVVHSTEALLKNTERRNGILTEVFNKTVLEKDQILRDALNDKRAIIQAIYAMAFERSAAQHESDEWLNHISNGLSIQGFIFAVSTSDELRQRRTFSSEITSQYSIEEIVKLIYTEIFRTGVCPTDFENTTEALRRQIKSPGQIIKELFEMRLIQMRPLARRKITQMNVSQVHMLGTDRLIDLSTWSNPPKGTDRVLPSSQGMRKKRDPGVLVSAVASMYKGEEYIEQFLSNITSQSIFTESCELIIVDAFSPGREIEVIRPFMRKFPNIKYHRTSERIGIYDAWNLGIRMSEGKFITNTNLDDLRRSDSFQLQLECFETIHFPDVVYQDFFYSFENNLDFQSIASHDIRCRLPIVTMNNLIAFNSPHNAPMWRRSLHDEVGWFNDDYRSAGDCDFWLRCAIKKKNFYKVNEPHVAYYWNPDGLSTNAESVGIVEHRSIVNALSWDLVPSPLTQDFNIFKKNLQLDPSLVNTHMCRYDLVQTKLLSLIGGHLTNKNQFGGETRVLFDTANIQINGNERFFWDVFGRFVSERQFVPMLLDRGNLTIPDGIVAIQFPSYSPSRFNAADSLLIQKVCDQFEIDLFVSSTPTPVRTPMLLLVLAIELQPLISSRTAMELELAKAFASFAIFETEDCLMAGLKHPRLSKKHIVDVCEIGSFKPEALDTSDSVSQEPNFYNDWSRLRAMQADVDTVIWDPL